MSREHYALDWIKGELLQTLNTARQGLEEFAEAWERGSVPEDHAVARGEGRAPAGDDEVQSGLPACVTALHQVHGSLVMLELPGIARLTLHLERVAARLLAGGQNDVAAMCQSLMQGILELPGYLDELQSGVADDALAVLPLVNELRAHLGEPAIDDGSIAGRLKTGASDAAIARFEAIDGVDKTRRIRAVYQQVLLAVLKGGDLRQAADTLRKIAEGMRRVCEQTPLELQWQAFAEFVESLTVAEQSFGAIDADAVKLLRRIDSEIREIAQSGSDALRRPLSMALMRQLVDGAISRGRASPVLDELLSGVEVMEKSPEISLPGRQALASAATALREELNSTRDRLDLFVRSEPRDPRQLGDLIAPLKQVASTLSLLGFESSKSIILDQLDVLTSLAEGEQVDEAAISGVAGALVQVDDNLASLTHGGRGEMEKITGDAQRAVADQARVGLERVKQSLVDYVSSQWDVRHLPEVPAELAAIVGALGMIPLAHAAALMQRCQDYVGGELLAGHVPTWEELDRLADAISGIDYYLERLASESPGGADEVLSLVQRSLDGLKPQPAPSLEPESFVVRVQPEPAAVPTSPVASPEVEVESDPVGGEFESELELEDEPELESEPAREPEAGIDLVSARTEALPENEPAPDDAVLELDADPAFDLSNALFDGMASEPVQPPPPAPALVDAALPQATVTPAAALPTSAGAASSDRVALLADNFDSDPEIVEIFLEEVDEVVAAIDDAIERWATALGDEGQHSDIRRAFHTLKGSGRIVGANVLAEMAWAVENMLNRVVDGTVAPTDEFVAVVRDARAQIPLLRSAFEQQTVPAMEGVGRVMEHADVLASGGSLADLADADGIPDAGTLASDDGSSDSDEYLALFLTEARGYLATLAAATANGRFDLDDEVMRALHTLSGSSAIARLPVVGEVAAPAYDLARALRRPGAVTALSGEEADYFREITETLSAMVEEVEAGRQPEEAFQLIAEADRLIAGAGETVRPEPLLALPSLGELMRVPGFLDAWRDGAMDLAFADDLRAALAEIRAVAEEQGHAAVAELSAVLLEAHERYEFAMLDSHAHGVLTQAHEQLLAHIDAIAANQAPRPIPELQAAVDELAPRREAADDVVSFDAVTEAEPADDPEGEFGLADLDSTVELNSEASAALEPGAVFDAAEASMLEDAPAASEALTPEDAPAAPERTPAPSEMLVPEDVDEELIGVFFEEADELLEALEQGVSDWAGAPDNLLPLENLLRALHTLKGGARLSGLSRLGDLTHELESFLIDFQSSAQPADAPLFAALHERYDEISALLAASKRHVSGGAPATQEPAPPPRVAPDDPAATISAAAPESVQPSAGAAQDASAAAAEAPDGAAFRQDADATVADSGEAPAALPPADNVARLPRAPQEPPVPGSRKPDMAARAAGAAGRKDGRAGEVRTEQEMVRVGAGLLEALVNLAGESSIIRARVEQSMSDFATSLDEMERTIHRLREQLRRLDIETEGQVLFRRDRGDGPAYENFDPLEMDRYSQLQQLSRSLTESASDLLDLKDTLLNKSREAETLLLQQARVNTELQEGLMRSRMVPFSRLLPRLRRTVRQVSRELDKQVELRAFNLEGELDRTLLERMLPPLEHMLRNAVDHGIEAPDQRRAAGKAEGGHIDLRLSREGGDLVIEISDDGAGIDVERVRAKAVERGLLAPDADLRDDEISQFVLAPGFSTARSVTQISGRGVGMDVVHSEVKQLGGNIDIFTQRGKGTRFLLRVPFTVSVNRALMVAVGEDLYAVPLNTIEGIVLLSPEELERLYAPNGHTFEYAGVPYRIQYLGNFLGREFRPQAAQGSVPVVLVRSGEQAVAVHVDGVQGSREIVVKSLGPQFAGVGGISGATILGDGSVVVILDLLALIRAQSGAGLVVGKRSLTGSQTARRVMVVDDSVTVRKVTSRLLERQGMDVLVAKDGVEAMAMLQEQRPDVLLLDIEMPRMDGFEVLRQVRHDERLRDLPVLMISSRTGAKHQQHAAELGVNGFLGKPFQESELLATIDKLMN